MTRPHLPPRVPAGLLRRCLPDTLAAETIRADLAEEFAEIARRHSTGAAVRWYWRQAVDVAVRVGWRRVRRRHSSRSPGHLPFRSAAEEKQSIMRDTVHDLRYAIRSIRKAPGFAAVVVATLALGVGANTAIFSLVNEVLLEPLPIHDEDRVVQLYTSDFSSGIFGTSSYPDLRSFREGNTTLEDLAAFSFAMPFNVGTTAVAERVNGMLVGGNYFGTLGVGPAVGRLLQPSDDVTPGAHPVVVLSHGLWTRQFGGAADAIGQSVLLNGQAFTVVGVTPEGFSGVQIGSAADVFVPIAMYATAFPRFANVPILELRGGRWLFAVGRLRPGETIERAQVEMTTIMTRLAEEFPRSNLGTRDRPDQARPVTLLPVRDAALGARRIGDTVSRARLLMVVVGIVLLIACANIANLLLARGTRRQREIAVRLAIGAGRRRLLRQLLTESMLLGLVGGAVGVGVAFALTRVLLPVGLPTVLQGQLTLPELPLDGLVLAFAVAISLATGVVFGLLPAVRGSNPDLVSSLKDVELVMRAKHRRFGARDVLAVAQIAGSLALLVGAGLFVRSALSMYRTDLGFDVENVAIVSLDVSRQGLDQPQGEAFYASLLERVRGLPVVRSATLANYVPVNPAGIRSSFVVEGEAAPESGAPEFNLNNVTPGFFETLGIPLVRGRVFTEADDADAPAVIVVNTTFANRYWPDQDPIGRRLLSDGGPTPVHFTVVGVVGDTKYRAVREEPIPYVYFPIAQAYQPVVTLAVKTAAGASEAVIPSIRGAVRELDPTMPVFDAMTLSDQLGQAMMQERSIAIMISALGGLALLLAAVGIYGVMAYAVSQRTQEIGIRSALGARGADVLWLILGRGLTISAAGIGIGVVVSLAASSAIEGFIVGVSPTDPVTFVVGAVGLTLVGLVASLVPAYRATRVDPLNALRAE